MVMLEVTGGASYNWLATKYSLNGNYDASCVTDFSQLCFEDAESVGLESMYMIELDATYQGQQSLLILMERN